MAIKIGTQIYHKLYGAGKVIDIELSLNQTKFTVDFVTGHIMAFLYPDSVKNGMITEIPHHQNNTTTQYSTYNSRGTSTVKEQTTTPYTSLRKFNIFKVHQNKTYASERRGGYLWAPASGKHHHERMKDIKVDDIIFHYSKQCIVAISEARSNCQSCMRPNELGGHGWQSNGYKVYATYNELYSPISLYSLNSQIRRLKSSYYSSFNTNGDGCQGYLFKLEYEIAKLIKEKILERNSSPEVKRILDRIV